MRNQDRLEPGRLRYRRPPSDYLSVVSVRILDRSHRGVLRPILRRQNQDSLQSGLTFHFMMISEAIIRIIAMIRSSIFARLKNAHHNMNMTPQPSPPKTLIIMAVPPPVKIGMIYQRNHCKITMLIPGHKRRFWFLFCWFDLRFEFITY